MGSKLRKIAAYILRFFEVCPCLGVDCSDNSNFHKLNYILMKRTLVLVCFCLAISAVANAQFSNLKNSISLDANAVTLGNVTETGSGYGFTYARHLAKDRVSIGGRLGYIKARGEDVTVNGFSSYARRSERFTADLTVAYNFLKSPRHALRLGVGPSAWLRKDDILRGFTFVKEEIDSPKIDRVDFAREDVQEVNFGGHLMGEYEFSVTQSLVLGVRGDLVQFNRNKTALNRMAGFKVGYRF